MPHINFSTFASQLFWLILVFTTIYFVLHKFYVPKIKWVIKQRAVNLNEYVSDSESLERKTKEIGALIAKEDEAIRQEVSDKKLSARKKAAQLFEQIAQKSRVEVEALQLEQEGELKKIIKLLDTEVESISAEVSSEIANYLKKMYNYNLKI